MIKNVQYYKTTVSVVIMALTLLYPGGKQTAYAIDLNKMRFSGSAALGAGTLSTLARFSLDGIGSLGNDTGSNGFYSVGLDLETNLYGTEFLVGMPLSFGYEFELTESGDYSLLPSFDTGIGVFFGKPGGGTPQQVGVTVPAGVSLTSILFTNMTVGLSVTTRAYSYYIRPAPVSSIIPIRSILDDIFGVDDDDDDEDEERVKKHRFFENTNFLFTIGFII